MFRYLSFCRTYWGCRESNMISFGIPAEIGATVDLFFNRNFFLSETKPKVVQSGSQAGGWPWCGYLTKSRTNLMLSRGRFPKRRH